jgi:translation initiation factor IF-3
MCPGSGSARTWPQLNGSASFQRIPKTISAIRKEQTIDSYRTNEQIRITPVRVIDAQGQQLGVIATREALDKAREAGLDLVEVAPEAKPPVCRIMDYGKFRYERNKKSHKNKAHQTRLKEIRVRPKTGDHDIEFKVKQAIGFLQHKDKVQVTVMFRGRELAHIEEGRKVMESIIEKLTEFGKIESPPSSQAKRMLCTIAPR